MILTGLSVGHKVVGGIILASLLAGGILYVRHTWIEQGKQDERAAQVVERDKALTQQKAYFESQLEKAEERERQAQQIAQAATAALQQNASALKAIAVQRQTVMQEVAAVPDSALKVALEAELGGALEEPPILRKNLAIVREAPLLQEEVKALGQRVELQEQKLAAQDQRIGAMQDKLDLSFRWADTVYAAYVEAYNAVPKKRRWYGYFPCFGLCGKPKNLKGQAPEQLLANRPKP